MFNQYVSGQASDLILMKTASGAQSRAFPQVGNIKNFVIDIVKVETFFYTLVLVKNLM